MKWLQRVMEGGLDFVFPGGCARCRSRFDRGSVLCRECDRELENLACAPACEMCAMPLTEHEAPCPYCLGKGPPLLERIVGLGVYEPPLRDVIHRAKYSGEWPVAEMLADRLLEKETVKALLSEADLLVAVPLHFRRQVARGYNQAAVIAVRLGRAAGIRCVRPAWRKRATDSQTSMRSRERRIENMRDAFGLRRVDGIEGKHVVLIDDVMTSGATLASLARALKPASPASISAIVVGVADPRGRGFEAI